MAEVPFIVKICDREGRVGEVPVDFIAWPCRTSSISATTTTAMSGLKVQMETKLMKARSIFR